MNNIQFVIRRDERHEKNQNMGFFFIPSDFNFFIYSFTFSFQKKSFIYLLNFNSD